MRVNEETVAKLKCIRYVLEEEVKKGIEGNDARGVYDRVADFLTVCANQGEDIAIARGHDRRIPYYGNEEARCENRNRFTPEAIREVALNEFSRYFVYGLKITEGDILSLLKKQIGEYANNPSKELSFMKTRLGWNASLSHEEDLNCWYYGLYKVANEVTLHWGTPLEALD